MYTEDMEGMKLFFHCNVCILDQGQVFECVKVGVCVCVCVCVLSRKRQYETERGKSNTK